MYPYMYLKIWMPYWVLKLFCPIDTIASFKQNTTDRVLHGYRPGISCVKPPPLFVSPLTSLGLWLPSLDHGPEIRQHYPVKLLTIGIKT